MNRYEKTLVLLLRLDAIILLVALIPSMMPLAWMKEIHRQLGMGELPNGPIIGYLTRSLSFMYAMHGAVELFVSLDVRRFLPVVKLIAFLGVLFGIWMTALDVAVGMPRFWVISEGPCITVLGGTLLWLSGWVRPSDKEAAR